MGKIRIISQPYLLGEVDVDGTPWVG